MKQLPLERLATVAVIVAALAVAIKQVRSSGVEVEHVSALSTAPRKVAEWRDILRDAISEHAGADSPVVIEFADFECPFCARFQREFELASSETDERFTYAFLHFPLPMHRFARPAARAAECAHKQGRFRELKRLLFSTQDSLGLMPWRQLAERAGVGDLAAFDECLLERNTDSLVTHRARWAEGLRIEGTPAVLVDSILYVGLSADSVLRIIRNAQQGG